MFTRTSWPPRTLERGIEKGREVCIPVHCRRFDLRLNGNYIPGAFPLDDVHRRRSVLRALRAAG